MKIIYDTLSGPALDWATAVAVGHDPAKMIYSRGYHDPAREHIVTQILVSDNNGGAVWFSSDNADVVLDIMKKYRISVYETGSDAWKAVGPGVMNTGRSSDTPEEAVCRCLVRIKLGYNVDIPNDLLLGRTNAGIPQ